MAFTLCPSCAGKCIDLTDCDTVGVLIGDTRAPDVFVGMRGLKVRADGVHVRLTRAQAKALPQGGHPVRLMARRGGVTLIADMEPLAVGG